MRTRKPTRRVVVFFPTCGFLGPEGSHWVLPIHGWVFDPERTTKVRRAQLALFRRYLRFKTRLALTPLFGARAASFFVNNQRGTRVGVRIGDRVHLLEKSLANGHFKGTVLLPVPEAHRLLDVQPDNGGWLNFEAAECDTDGRVFRGRVHLLPGAGLSVISDIDDTIKHSAVHDRRELLANTFLRDFSAIPAAAEVYRTWAEAGVKFHYVSSSPWQLFEPLASFLGQEGFPEGTLHLRLLRIRDSRPFKLFVRRQESKARTIDGILQSFPGRRFVLIGDSGERDPEIYGEIARRNPAQVVRILIRDLRGEGRFSERFQHAFAGVPPERWSLYRNVDELRSENAIWVDPARTGLPAS